MPQPTYPPTTFYLEGATPTRIGARSHDPRRIFNIGPLTLFYGTPEDQPHEFLPVEADKSIVVSGPTNIRSKGTKVTVSGP